MVPDPVDLPMGRVLVALLLQTAGYAAMLALFPHSSPTTVVDHLAGVPPVVLIPLAIPAIPAVLLTVASGAVLGAVGTSPGSLPALFLARGDVLFVGCALAVALVAAWADERSPEAR